MNPKKRPKNVETVGGIKYYKRWTVLGVEIAIIDMIRNYAAQHDVTIKRALSEMIRKASGSQGED